MLPVPQTPNPDTEPFRVRDDPEPGGTWVEA